MSGINVEFGNFARSTYVFTEIGGTEGSLAGDQPTRLDFDGYSTEIFSISFTTAPSPLTYGASSGGTAGDPFSYLGLYDADGTLLGTISGFTRTAEEIKTGYLSGPRFEFLLDLIGGDSIITGGLHGDELEVGTGGKAIVAAGDGEDVLTIRASKDVDFDGGAHTDKLVFSPSPAPAVGALVNLAAGTGVNPYGGTLTFKDVEDIQGTALADDLRGNKQANTFDGNGGYDTLRGGGGDDTLIFDLNSFGGPDKFIAEGGTGTDSLQVLLGKLPGGTPTVYLDILDPSKNTSVFKDAVITGIETYVLGDNKVRADQIALNFAGGAGEEWVTSGRGNDTLLGRGGNDTLDGGGGNDRLEGGRGDDRLKVSVDDPGVDALDGGSGTDMADVRFSSSTLALVLDLTDPTITHTLADGTVLTSIEQIEFSSGKGNDSIVGGALVDHIYGAAGKDTLRGGDGDDELYGGSGKDRVFGGSGNDMIGSEDLDRIDGGSGVDALDLTRSKLDAAMTIDISDPTIKQVLSDGTTIVGIEWFSNVFGGTKGDHFTGGALDDNISGRAGKDLIDGRDGNDDLSGDAGRDTLIGSDGDDYLGGGAGSDSLDGGDGDDSLYGGSGSDTLAGGDGNDLARLDGYEKVVLTLSASGNGTFSVAGLGTDTYSSIEGLEGGVNDDTLHGNAQANLLLGDEGNDKLFGEEGNDTLSGGDGKNTLKGGAGDDTFVFDGQIIDGMVTRIADFASGPERIELAMYAVNELIAFGALQDAQFKDLGVDGAKLDKDDRIVYNSDTGDLAFDRDGSGSSAAIVFAHLDNKAHLGAADFTIV